MTSAVRTVVRSVLLGGLVAGSIDIGAAALINRVSPVVIMRAVAGGLLGTATFGMGAFSAMLGLILQWLISLVIAAIFVTVCRRMPVLGRRWIRAGLAYGVVVFLVMNFIVMPLSAYHRLPRLDPVHVAGDVLAMLLFGLIVAFFARRAAAVR